MRASAFGGCVNVWAVPAGSRVPRRGGMVEYEHNYVTVDLQLLHTAPLNVPLRDLILRPESILFEGH